MINLLEETEDMLAGNGKSPADVLWCGTPDMSFGWEVFAELAKVKYDSGFGAQEVAKDLLIVGDGWWLERHEYDGSEWWEFKLQPTAWRCGTPKSLVVTDGMCGWATLKEIHEGKKDCEGEE